MFAGVRSGKWDALLQEPAPDSAFKYASLLDAFGKGLASVRKNDTASANRYLSKIKLLITDSSLSVRNMPFNKAVQAASIAEGILSGELLAAKGKSLEAIAALRRAVAAEDALIYREPKEWPIPARHFLGAALLQQHNYKDAEKIYREDLLHNPGNGWALIGLYHSMRDGRRKKEAARYKVAYTVAFTGADEIPPGSVY